MRTTSFTLFILAALSHLAFGEQPDAKADKSQFNLFSPTPEALMRDFDTDRPDKTNSAHTVDAGHIQLEMDLLSFARDRQGATRSESWLWGNNNLRLGLTNWADIQFLVPFYQMNRDKDTATGKTDRSTGIGDLTIALKTNFWGNDGGDTSCGMEFFVKTPTATHHLGNGRVEGGALVLYGTKLPADFDLGINSGVAINAGDSGGHHADVTNSISVSHTIAGPLSAYVEFFSDIDVKHSADWIGTVDVGLTLMLGKNVQLDTGLNIGVTRAAGDLQAFLGMSVRF